MNALKELLNKIYSDLQQSDRIKQYPSLTEKDIVWDIIQWIALDIMPNFIEKNKLEEFVDESEKNYKEETFKKYVINYPEFLDNVEQDFYNNLLLWLTE